SLVKFNRICQADKSGAATRIFCQVESPSTGAPYQVDPWKRPTGSAIQDIHKVRFGDEMHITIHLYARVPFKAQVHGKRLEIILEDAAYRNPLKQMFFKGVSLQNRNELAHAMERYQNVLKHDKKFAPAYYKAGQIRLEWRDFNRAEINLRRAQQLGCDSVGVYKALADLYRELGNESRARRLYEKYAELNERRALPDTISGFKRKGVASLAVVIPEWAKEENTGILGITQSGLYKFILFILTGMILKVGFELWRWRERRSTLLYRRSFIPTQEDFYDVPYDPLEDEQAYDDQEEDESRDGFFTADEYDSRNSYWQEEETDEVNEDQHNDEESSQALLDADHLIRLLLKEEQRVERLSSEVFPESDEKEENDRLQELLHLQRTGLTLPQIARRTGLGQEDILFLLWVEQQRILVYGSSK
ncbi:MAG: hypothetical protein AAFP70_14890, partial [Calditrichota bacterium]